MEAAPTLPRATPVDQLRRLDWQAVSTWLLGFGLVVYLGLKGGGYDPLVHDQIGIAVWWVLIATVVAGALPRRRPGVLAWVTIGLLTAFAAWTMLSLGWTESSDRTFADGARVISYLGVLVLAVFAHGRRSARRMIAAVGAGIAFLAIVALLSRLHPAWFPEAAQTDEFLGNSEDRLSFPLNYWNGLGALIAMGLPAVLQVATCAKTIHVRAVAAAAIPALALTLFFTLSRGGIAAAALGVGVFLALTSDRLPKALAAIVGGVGGAILVLAADQREALQSGLLNSAAENQGNEMLVMTVVVCLGVGLIQAGISLALAHGLRPEWARPSRRQTKVGIASAAAVLLLVAVAFDAPGRTSDAWADFKTNEGPGSGTARLGSAAGESRYKFWSAAVREQQSEPVTGTGSGTFEYWWARDGDAPDVVDDAHSLYMQTFGELGIVGVLLLAGLVTVILGAGVRRTLQAGSRGRPQLAAALAGCVAFFFTAAFDWMWQLPVLPIAMLLLASAFLGASRSPRGGRAAVPTPVRAVFALVGLVAVVAIAIPLSSASLIRQSQAEARAGNVSAALDASRAAENVQPDAAAPRLQQALLLESLGELRAASVAALEATTREPTNWQTWLVLSRIEAERGDAQAALRHYRKARSLNPRALLFAR